MPEAQHLVQYLPSRRGLLGGGDSGYVVCTCGWQHQAVDNRTARKLTKAHIDGELR